MAITVSGIDPTAVQALVRRIQEFNRFMDQKFNYIETDIKKKMDQAYGGAAADSLMAKTVRLMSATREVNTKMIKNVVENINDDLNDTQHLDNSL